MPRVAHRSSFRKAHATIAAKGIAVRRRFTSKILAALIAVLSPQSHAQAQSHCFACNIVESGYLPDSVGEQLIFRSERVLAVGVRPEVQQVEVRFGTGALLWVDGKQLYTLRAAEERRRLEELELPNCDCRTEQRRSEDASQLPRSAPAGTSHDQPREQPAPDRETSQNRASQTEKP